MSIVYMYHMFLWSSEVYVCKKGFFFGGNFVFNTGYKCSNYHTTALISHASNVMLKILQAMLQQYMNRELPDVQAGFRKRGTRDQIANIPWIMEKARELQKIKA